MLGSKLGKIKTVILLVIGALVFAPAQVFAVGGVYISEEVGGDSVDNRQLVDALDDAWRVATVAGGAMADDFETASITPGATGITELLTTEDGVVVSISLQDMTNVDDTSGFGAQANTQGKAGSDTSTSMQDNAPKPASFVDESYYNETAGSSKSRNGLKIDFSEPVEAFGAWFGDVETRTDGNGVPAVLRLYDEDDILVGSEVTLEPTIEDQSQCGAPVDDDFDGCGNDTTRWIGFISGDASKVSSMVLVVGEDDTTEGTNTGDTEHLSMIGATVVTSYSGSVPTSDPQDDPIDVLLPGDDLLGPGSEEELDAAEEEDALEEDGVEEEEEAQIDEATEDSTESTDDGGIAEDSTEETAEVDTAEEESESEVTEAEEVVVIGVTTSAPEEETEAAAQEGVETEGQQEEPVAQLESTESGNVLGASTVVTESQLVNTGNAAILAAIVGVSLVLATAAASRTERSSKAR